MSKTVFVQIIVPSVGLPGGAVHVRGDVVECNEAQAAVFTEWGQGVLVDPAGLPAAQPEPETEVIPEPEPETEAELDLDEEPERPAAPSFPNETAPSKRGGRK